MRKLRAECQLQYETCWKMHRGYVDGANGAINMPLKHCSESLLNCAGQTCHKATFTKADLTVAFIFINKSKCSCMCNV